MEGESGERERERMKKRRLYTLYHIVAVVEDSTLGHVNAIVERALAKLEKSEHY